jgi:UDP-N-acetylglucosamine 2-epimerase
MTQTIGGAENSRIWAPEPDRSDPEAPAVAELANALEQLESLLVGQECDLVLLADDSEEALAAALVAMKLLIEVCAGEAARNPESANGRLIAQLADAYTDPA